MTQRKILRVDNPDELKVLKTRSHQIKQTSAALRQLADDMFETMHAANGVGLAAPQVGILQRIAVIWVPAIVEELDDGSEREVVPEQSYVLINPEIIKTSPNEFNGQEGCLSMPGWYADVPRHAWVTVEYQDLDGKRQRIRRATGLLARALQHEIDHLDGVLFTERIRDLSTLKDYSKEAEPAPPE